MQFVISDPDNEGKNCVTTEVTSAPLSTRYQIVSIHHQQDSPSHISYYSKSASDSVKFRVVTLP